MNIKIIKTGYLKENCYVIIKNNNAIIIDPGDEENKIIEECKGLNVKGILVTHFHFDHVGALEKVKEYYHIKEINNYINDFDYEIIKTPGHSSDSITFYFKKEKIMFVGDFIFENGIGRTDLESGSIIDMKNSLTKISKYDDDIILYPGHGNKTILGKEKIRFNSYFC